MSQTNGIKKLVFRGALKGFPGGTLSLDLRAKGLTPRMVQWALETGVNFNVATKYTCEGTALPYHPTQMRQRELDRIDNYDSRQRYGYVDFLNKENMFDVIFRLWNIGTHRLFTWADPDYARRFSQSVGLGNRGFQVTPPLSMKINPWPLFDDPSLISYQWEDERYWAWYLLFGRLGYSSDTPPDVWEREFQVRYGEAGAPLLMAYQVAGKVLPLLTSAHLTRHPVDYNWAEGVFRATEMQWNGDSFSAAIPSEYLTSVLDIMVYFSAHNGDSQTLLYPGLFNPDYPAPYFVVEIEE